MFTDEIRKNFLLRYGFSLRDLSRQTHYSDKYSASPSAKNEIFIGRGYPFFGKTVKVEKEEAECVEILKKW